MVYRSVQAVHTDLTGDWYVVLTSLSVHLIIPCVDTLVCTLLSVGISVRIGRKKKREKKKREKKRENLEIRRCSSDLDSSRAGFSGRRNVSPHEEKTATKKSLSHEVLIYGTIPRFFGHRRLRQSSRRLAVRRWHHLRFSLFFSLFLLLLLPLPQPS
ncbi:hypothetical protein GW17_00052804 [Ensete ventricosum]|nr:hypothetical protein GW17_00052804 [Ensete ventricosum]